MDQARYAYCKSKITEKNGIYGHWKKGTIGKGKKSIRFSNEKGARQQNLTQSMPSGRLIDSLNSSSQRDRKLAQVPCRGRNSEYSPDEGTS
jgi:hypothetical protein